MWRVWGQGYMRGFAGMLLPRLMCLWVKESLGDYIRQEDSLCHSTSKRYPGNRIPTKTNAQIGSCLWFLKSYLLRTFLGFTLSANVTVFQAFKGHHPFLEKSCLNYSLARSWNEALRINVPCIYYIRGFFPLLMERTIYSQCYKKALWLLNQWRFRQSPWRKSHLNPMILKVSILQHKVQSQCFLWLYLPVMQAWSVSGRAGPVTSCQMQQSWPRGYSNMCDRWIKSTKLGLFPSLQSWGLTKGIRNLEEKEQKRNAPDDAW